MNREILEKPFGPEQIKQREGNFGRMLDYIEGHAVIQRLNDAFDAQWSFAILHHEVLNETDEAIVLGELKADGVVKTQFGSSRITRNRQTGEMVSLADDYKSAGTDALKKCATLLGVGLHLYGENPQRQQRKSHRQPQGHNGGNGNRQRPAGNGGRKNGNGNGRLSQKQYQYLMALATKDLAMTRSELDNLCLEMFGTTAPYLSKKDASSVIENLLAR
jgi:recombination DNA repair RAD52 pathway protein